MTKIKAPLGISIKLTNKCNLSCIHCIAECGEKTQNELNIKDLKKIIDDIKDNEVFMIHFTGGEVLLYEKFYEILNYVKAKDMLITFETNGTLITEQDALNIKKIGVGFVKVSLDFHTEIDHDNFRGKEGAFRKTIEGIKILKKHGIDVTIQTVVSHLNINYLENITLLAIDLGVDAINFFSLVPGGRANNIKNNVLDKNEIKDFFKQINKLIKKYNHKISIVTESPLSFVYNKQKGNPVKISSTYICLASKVMLFIKENGDVIPCPYFADINLGNLKNTKLKTIWENSKLTELENFDLLDNDCKKCDHVQICNGGCRAASYNLYNTISKKDPFCWL